MFDVIQGGSSSHEVIGKAVKIDFGFRINIFNGGTLLLVKSNKFKERYEIYNIDESNVSRKDGYGKFLDYTNEWVEFDHGSSNKAYIYLSVEGYTVSEFREVVA